MSRQTHIDTHRQAWQMLRRCSYRRNDWRGSKTGRIVHIALYEREGVCAQVQFGGEWYDTEWYNYDGRAVCAMALGPSSFETGIIPPGCWA